MLRKHVESIQYQIPSKNLKNIFITEKHMKYEKDTGCIEARVFPKCLVIKFSPVGILKCGETLC